MKIILQYWIMDNKNWLEKSDYQQKCLMRTERYNLSAIKEMKALWQNYRFHK
jgi:hypothetical protein